MTLLTAGEGGECALPMCTGRIKRLENTKIASATFAPHQAVPWGVKQRINICKELTPAPSTGWLKSQFTGEESQAQREVEEFAPNHTASQLSSLGQTVWSWISLGANPISVTSLLHDIRQVTQFLWASVSSSTKWGRGIVPDSSGWGEHRSLCVSRAQHRSWCVGPAW